MNMSWEDLINLIVELKKMLCPDEYMSGEFDEYGLGRYDGYEEDNYGDYYY